MNPPPHSALSTRSERGERVAAGRVRGVLLFMASRRALLSSVDSLRSVGSSFFRVLVFTLVWAEFPLWGAGADPFADLDAAASGKQPPSSASDPFADLDAAPSTKPSIPPSASGAEPSSSSESAARIEKPGSEKSLLGGFFADGFSFKKEIMLELSRSSAAADMPGATAEGLYSRNSLGFEILKKFSTDTATVAAFDVQIRLVRRDNFHEVLNDAEGADRDGWFLEYHNFYWDFYNVFNPLLDDEARGRTAGTFNLRAGRFYLPFGLNLQTDTHGTLLQLSNERNFGYERDWYAGFWGSINSDFNYDCYYLLGSGYDLSFKGQQGLIGNRISLGNKYLNEYGIESGLSFLGGQRLSEHALDRSPSVAMSSGADGIIDTLRGGGDLRWRHRIPTGSVILTTELSAGRDEEDNVLTQLYQAEYLTLNRKFGVNAQYRRFHQNIQSGTAESRTSTDGGTVGKTDASLIGELTWYFRNDLGNATLRWIKLNVEQKTETQQGPKDTIVTLQYYHYW